MTDPTRPPSPGETPVEGMSGEIPTETADQTPLAGEPGIADDLAPDGGESRLDVPAASSPFEVPSTSGEQAGDHRPGHEGH